jgi:hypothetical protein
VCWLIFDPERVAGLKYGKCERKGGLYLRDGDLE